MRDEAERIDLIAVEEHIHLHEIARLILAQLIVERGIALRARLERVEKVIYYLVERHLIVQLDKARVEILHILILAAPVLTQRHDVADKLLRRDDGDLHKRLVRLGDGDGVGVVVGVVHHDGAAVGLADLVDDGGQRGDKLQIKFALQTLLYYLHMQHPQKAAAEAKAQRDGALRLIRERGVVELELFQRVAQIRILRAVLGVYAAVYHRSCGAVAGQRRRRGAVRLGDGVAHAGVLNVFDAGGEVAHVARGKLLARFKPYRAHMPDLDHLIPRAGAHEQYLRVAADNAVHHAHENDNAAIVVILAVEDERLERRGGVAGGRGHVRHDVLKHCVDVHAVFRADLRRVLRGQPDDLLHLVLHALRVSRGQVDLVDDGEYLKVVVEREIGVGERLRLHALRGVDYQHRALARRERAADLIVEVHVPRSVDKVERVGLPVGGAVVQPDGARLYRDAALALKLHIVEYLILHHALLNGVALLYQPVRERGLAVVDVRDYGKIAYQLLIYHCRSFLI